MIVRWRSSVIMSVLATALCLSAQQPNALHLHGTVTDDKSHLPVAGVRVSVVGGSAKHNDTTTVKGDFDLPLLAEVRPGQLIRLRAEKEGYDTYDEYVAASAEIHLQIPLVPRGKSSRGAPAQQVMVRCHLSDKQSACELYCSIENAGAQAAHDASIGFVGTLPSQTQLSADPDARVRLEKSDTLPVPDPMGNFADDIVAFTIRVPIAPPRSTISFALWTNDENNKKACEQEERIRQIRRELLAKFFEEVRLAHLPQASSPLNLSRVMSAEAKISALFQPKSITSDRGRTPVQLVTMDESAALARFAQLFTKLRPQFPNVFKDGENCTAPIFTVEQTGGKSTTFARFVLVDPKVYVEGKFIVPERGGQIDMRFTSPASYHCGRYSPHPGDPADMAVSPR